MFIDKVSRSFAMRRGSVVIDLRVEEVKVRPCVGKPTVPENLMSTLTSSDDNFVHTSSFFKIIHASCAVVTLEHLKPFRIVNYILRRRFLAYPLKGFFYGETIGTLMLIVYIQGFYPSF